MWESRRALRAQEREALQSQTNPRFGRRVLWLGFFIIALAVGWSFAWHWLSARAGELLDGQIAAAAERGTVLNCPERSVAGFPFRFELSCTEPRLTLARAGNLEIAAKRLRLIAMVWRPNHFVADLDGPADVNDPATGTAYTLTWQRGQGSLRFGLKGIVQASLVFDAAKLAPAASTKGISAEVEAFALHGRPAASDVSPATSYDIAVTAKDLDLILADGRAAPLISLEADGTAHKVRDAALSARNSADFLRKWQAAGGSFDVSAYRAEIGDTLLALGSGALSIADNGTLSGRLDSRIAGLERLLAPAGGLIAAVGPAVLGPATEIEGKAGRSVTVKIDRGRVTVGPIGVGELPPLYRQ